MAVSSWRPALRAGMIGVLLGLLLGSQPGWGQPTRLSAQSRISLITILPGDPVYTFAGHSALRVRDPAQNLDRLYNYGTFDFGDPLFIPKFTYGDLRYHLSVAPYGPVMRVYRRQGRPVIEQSLALNRSQRTEVYQFLRVNARPENRYYQYDFFFDNCSTRIRDVLERTLGPSIDFSAVSVPEKSFRELLDPYVAPRPALDLGFDLALGLPADRSPSRREVMFLPEHLMEAFDEAVVTTTGGSRRPLVARTDTVLQIPNYQALTPAFDWPIALSVALFVLTLGWTARQVTRRQRPEGRGDAVLLASVGLVGLVVCYLWFVSTYTVTDHNLNLLWAWPTHLWAAYLLLRRPSAPRLRLYLAATALATLVVVSGWAFWPQRLHASLLPLVASIGLRTGWWALLLYGAASPHSPAPTSTP